MTREKTYFGFGLGMGIVIAFLFLYYFAPRYITVKSGDTLIKQDRWSGQTWRFVSDEWKRIVGENHDWEKIDTALREALGIQKNGPERTDAINSLRKKKDVLNELSEDDLLERIKVVYSKEILVNLYLQNFLKLGEESKDKK
jgi:hypothetical protein